MINYVIAQLPPELNSLEYSCPESNSTASSRCSMTVYVLHVIRCEHSRQPISAGLRSHSPRPGTLWRTLCYRPIQAGNRVRTKPAQGRDIRRLGQPHWWARWASSVVGKEVVSPLLAVLLGNIFWRCFCPVRPRWSAGEKCHSLQFWYSLQLDQLTVIVICHVR